MEVEVVDIEELLTELFPVLLKSLKIDNKAGPSITDLLEFSFVVAALAIGFLVSPVLVRDMYRNRRCEQFIHEVVTYLCMYVFLVARYFYLYILVYDNWR